MYLKKLQYQETTRGNSGAQEWRLDSVEFGQINLIVGKNSSGKTRVVNIINGLARLASGKINPVFSSGKWFAEFERMKGQAREGQRYSIDLMDFHVNKESFHIGQQLVMNREGDGNCFVLRKANSERVRYKVPLNQLAVVVRRDEIQHPFFEHLFRWGNELCAYRFGSDFGKSNASLIQFGGPVEEIFTTSEQVENATHVFRKTHERFGEKYKDDVLSDLNELGYKCTDISLSFLPGILLNGNSPLVLTLKEADLANYTLQGEMSQGMYRALALSIHVNANIFWAKSKKVGRDLQMGDLPMLLIDDIGEGLDFERSRRLVKILIKKAIDNHIQLVMSSNDRFIMNDVPLEYWTVLHREGGLVRGFSHRNAKKAFDEFEYLGLNNFDFFSGEHFLEK